MSTDSDSWHIADANAGLERAMIEEYVKKTKTTIWIQHDYRANAKLKKSPAFYE